MKPLKNPLSNRWVAPAVVGVSVMAASALAFTLPSDKAPQSGHPSVKLPMDEAPVANNNQLARGSFAPIVKEVAPAVVKVEMTRAAEKNTALENMPGLDDPSLRQFFGQPFGPSRGPRQHRPQMEHGLGSGVIVTKDGYILTNNHVVDGAKELKVTLQDGRELTAKVIGRDPKSDIAVIKVEANDLPIVRLADSEKVQVGDVVLAVGNPFGVGQTVTQGIVSATDRGNMGIEDYENFIQTDAAINPGNSGGALVDIDGRLIGINTAILSRSGGSQGVGFAVPSNLARTVMESLVSSGHVTRGYLGVMIQNLTPDLEKEFNLKDRSGALIGDVVAGGPAEKAGLKPGDVLLKFNGKKVTDGRHLQLAVAETKPGATVPVQILRDGNNKTVDVTVKPLPGTDEVAQAGSVEKEDTGTLNGVAVGDLNPETREQLNVPKDIRGAVVTEVEPNSAAAQAGIKSGDVIEEINRHPVKNAQDAVRLTEKTENHRTLVRVWEKGASRYVVVDESQKAG